MKAAAFETSAALLGVLALSEGAFAQGAAVVQPVVQAETGETLAASELQASEPTEQQVDPSAGTEADIVVTAQRRAEPLQEVPFSIGALSGSALEEYGAEGFRTFANRIAGLQLTTTAPGNTNLAIRGVVTSLDAGDRPQLSTTVGLYLDDISIGVTAANPDLQVIDLERVEVLRGPQGTLYGAGSMSGTIRLITRKPDLDAFEVRGLGEVSRTDFGEINWRTSAVVNVPLIGDLLALRLVGFYRSDGGWLDNVRLGKRNTNDGESYGGRAALRFQPIDALTIDAKAVFQNLHYDDQTNFNGRIGFPKRNVTINEPDIQRSRIYDLSAEYDLGPVSLTSVTSYQTKYTFAEPDVGLFARLLGARRGQFPVVTLPSETKLRGFSQEARLASTGEGRLRWVTGLYYSSIDRDFLATLDVPGIEAGTRIPPGSAFGVRTDRIYQGPFFVDNRQYAAFVDGTLGILEGLSVSAGVRYYDFKQHVDVDYRGILAAGDAPLKKTIKENGFNPRFNVSLDVTDDHLVYAQVARGFRLGGVNEPIPEAVCGPELVAAGLGSGPTDFESDKLWNYEVGAKTSWGNGRVIANASLFYIDYTDAQVQRRLNCGYSIIQNAGKLTSKGFELETKFRPAQGFSLGFNASHVDSRLEANVPTFGVKGARAPYVPRWALSGFANFEGDLGPGWIGFIGADVQYVSSRFNRFRLTTRPPVLPSYAIANVRAGVERGPWRFTVFADNIGDERAVLSLINYPFSDLPSLRTNTARPRTVGVSLGYRM